MFDQWGMMDGWGGAGPWMLAGVLAVAVIVSFGAWFLARETRHARAESPTALEILRARLARGEITEDEFRTARNALDG
jgi:uncharacterized membrane protein